MSFSSTKIIDYEILKSIFDDINNNAANDLQNDIEFITCLEHTALENNVEEDVNLLMKRKQLAFRCLRLFPKYDLNNDFCLTFFNSISNELKLADPDLIESTAFKNLSKYVTSSGLKEKVSLLQTFIICLTESRVNFSVFKDFPTNEWRLELLIFALLHDSTAHVDSIQHVIDIIIKSKNLENDTSVILEILLCNRNEHEFDIHFIYDVFFTIYCINNDCINVNIFVKLAHNFKQVQNEINQIKLLLVERTYSEFTAYQTHEVEFQYFLQYPWDVIGTLVARKQNFINIEDLFELKRVLEICEMNISRQIDIFRSQKANYDPINKWRDDIVYEIVKNVICDVFTAYGNYCLQVRNTDLQVESKLLVSEAKIKCICHNLNDETCALHQTDECCNLLYRLNTSLARVFVCCCKITEKVIHLVEDLITGINTDKRIVELINTLDILDEYDIQFIDTELCNFFTEFSADDYEHVQKFVIEHSFPGTYEKSVDQLLNEIENTNPETTISIVELFTKIEDCYNKRSVLFPENDKIKFWDEPQIKRWSVLQTIVYKLQTKARVSAEEKLAVIKRTAEVTSNLKLRDVQLLSVLMMIDSVEEKGRLAQVNTGEGKTLIIAALAAYCVFIGHKVDIFTSSSVLAIPQSGEFKTFYEALGISVTHNILPNSDYTCDVVYGTNHSFQRDALQDDFRKTGIRKRRKFDMAIVDEVDNMLIDGNNWILQLTSNMPAMDHLEVLLAAIHIQVMEAASSLIERDGTTYYLSEENAIDDEGNVKPEIDFQEIPIEGSKKDFIIRTTETHIRKLIRDTDSCKDIDDNYPEIKIPKHLREVIVKVQLRKWIKSAINAIFNYEKNEDYILRDGKITIVDVENTGVVKQNSHWGSGLHQFLEIKHGAKVEPENFTTNFISNVGLFTKYSKIYGLTGTLGSKDTIKFLQNTYKVDSVIIPPYKLKQHKHLKDIIVNNEEDKYVEIAKSCIRKLRKGRAVLVIMKYIRETDELADMFKTHFNYNSTKIKLFKTDDDADIVTKPLKPGDVIITTNIAGRGTDIKLTKHVEENGGLHVCLTFLPPNTRIEHQNIGRTSRKGNRGTSQYIICHPTCTEMQTLKMIRGKQEAKTMAGASETVKRVKAKELVFQKFCDLIDNIKGRNTTAKATELKAVEERFAIWLILNEDKLDEGDEELLNSFNDFRNEIMKDDAEDELIKNPYMYVELGNKYLKIRNFEEAITEYTNAIILDHDFAENAYYNRAWAYIALYGCNVNKYGDFINSAVRDLKKARKLIQDREYSLHLMQTASKGEVISEQISHKLNLYSVQKNTIELAIGPDVDAIDEQLKILREDAKNKNLPTDYKTKINEAIKNLEENKKNIGIIERAKRNNRNISIESLEDNFMPKPEQESHKDEIEELTRNGWVGAFKISEIKPIPWTSVISLLGIGLGQLIIGAALTVFTLGAGATIGMGLISEGVSDMITAIKDGIINRDFDWATWALMKVISVAVSVVCAGFKAIKDAARTAYAGAKNIMTAGAKTFTQTTKQGWKIVAKKMGLELAKGIGKEIVTDLVTYGINQALLPTIEELIIEHVRSPIQEALINNDIVGEMLKLDEQNNNNHYESQIRMKAQMLLNPETNSRLKTIATTIATSVADQKGLAITRQVCAGLIGVYELTTFTTDFIDKMNRSIEGISIKKEEKITETEQSAGIRNEVEADHVQEQQSSKNTDGDIDLNKAGLAEEQVQLQKKVRTTDYLSDELAGLVSTNMLHILKGKIIAPITRMGVNYTVDKVTSRVTNKLEENIKNYRSLKNIIHYQNNSDASTSHETENNDNKKDIEKKVDEIIQNIENGGPAGLLHLGAISDATDRPIEVYDEKGRLKYTIGDTKKSNPIEVQYHAPKNDSETGHYTRKDCQEPLKTGKGTNMCLFNVIAEQTGQNPNQLKQKTVDIMKNNKSSMGNQVKHIKRLEMYDRSNLIEGGAQFNGKNVDHALHFLRNSNGVIGFDNVNPAHNDIHIPFKGQTIHKLNAVADETGRQIEVYDKKGNLAYVIGEAKDNSAPIKLQYHKPKGDISGECFSSLGGNEKYYLHDPNDRTFYNIVGAQTGTSPTVLQSATLSRIDRMRVPPGPCIENDTLTKVRPKTGFRSEADQARVLHHAMQTPVVQKKLAELNKYKPGVNDSKQYKKQIVHISEKELNLPRPAYGGYWENGKLKLAWPVKDVVILLQHYDGHQSNPKARVHIQTFYPKPP